MKIPEDLLESVRKYLGKNEAESAIERSYMLDEDGIWKLRSVAIEDLSRKVMRGITMYSRVEPIDGRLIWSSISSDILEDSYGDSATLSLFNDFKEYADLENNPPYLSVSHYQRPHDVPEIKRALLGDTGVPGNITTIEITSQDQLLLSGEIFQNPLGLAAYNALQSDRFNEDQETKIRSSIGFYDYGHAHGRYIFIRSNNNPTCPLCALGVEGVQFMFGELDHLALTRVPVNPRTTMMIGDTEMAARGKTRQDDAASIIGEELAALLEGEGEQARSMIYRADAEQIDELTPPVVPVPTQVRSEPPSVAPPIATPTSADPLHVAAVAFLRAVEQANTTTDVDTALNSLSAVARSHVAQRHPEVAILNQLAPMIAEAVARSQNGLAQQMQTLAQQVQALAASVQVVNRSVPGLNDGSPRNPLLVDMSLFNGGGNQQQQPVSSIDAWANASTFGHQ